MLQKLKSCALPQTDCSSSSIVPSASLVPMDAPSPGWLRAASKDECQKTVVSQIEFPRETDPYQHASDVLELWQPLPRAVPSSATFITNNAIYAICWGCMSRCSFLQSVAAFEMHDPRSSVVPMEQWQGHQHSDKAG